MEFEIADDQDSPALLTGGAQMIVGSEPTQRVGQGVLSATLLPAGRYVARARITRGDNMAGVLVRPFILDLPPAGTAMPSPFTQGSVAKFDPKLPLSPRVLGEFLALVEKQFPELKSPLAEARAGRYGIAAIEALTSGDQAAAAFFKGLDWYSKGQLTQAVTQLELAAGPRREFFPAAFYLGASFAAAGRDRDAAGVWQMAIGKEPRPPLFYLLLADARLRDSQPASVVDVLKPAFERAPNDDEIGAAPDVGVPDARSIRGGAAGPRCVPRRSIPPTSWPTSLPSSRSTRSLPANAWWSRRRSRRSSHATSATTTGLTRRCSRSTCSQSAGGDLDKAQVTRHKAQVTTQLIRDKA